MNIRIKQGMFLMALQISTQISAFLQTMRKQTQEYGYMLPMLLPQTF